MKSGWPRIGIVLLIVLLAADAVLIFQERRSGREESAPAAPVFPGDRIGGIEIQVPGKGSAVFEKSGGTWRVSSASGRDYSSVLAEFLERDLASQSPEMISGATPENLEEFGLDAERAVTVRFSSAEGGGAEIHLGKNLPLDILYVYARVDGREGLYRILASFRDRILAGQ